MLPDLGKYLIPVLSAYAAMIVLILGLLAVSLARGKSSKKTLAELEEKHKKERRHG